MEPAMATVPGLTGWRSAAQAADPEPGLDRGERDQPARDAVQQPVPPTGWPWGGRAWATSAPPGGSRILQHASASAPA